MANLFHARRATVANQTPGYRNRAYIAAVSQFTTIAEPAPSSVGAASVTVVADHVFTGVAASNGFYEVYLKPKSVDAPSDSVGEAGALSSLWKPKIFLPGDTAAQQAMVQELMNQDAILLLDDATCPGGGTRQYGCDCTPVNVTSAKFTSGVVGGTVTKGWELELEAGCRFFYEGTVEIHP